METFQGTELTPLTKKLLAKYCEETKEKPEDVVQKALEKLLEKQQVTETKQPNIEYETVTLQIPKKLMDFLRRTPGGYGSSPVAYLEYSIVDMIRADLEGATGEQFIEWNDLGPVFHAILKDKRFVSL